MADLLQGFPFGGVAAALRGMDPKAPALEFGGTATPWGMGYTQPEPGPRCDPLCGQFVKMRSGLKMQI